MNTPATTNTAITTQSNPIEAALMQGDLSKLSANERLMYYQRICSDLGLNPLTSPFQYLSLNGKLVLYATKAAAEQLRSVKGISITRVEKELMDGMLVVTAYGTDKSGRQDTSTAALDVSSLRGEAKANAYMKCETKAKRRLTLSLSGLGMLDETEVETIPGARVVTAPPPMLPGGGADKEARVVSLEEFPVPPVPTKALDLAPVSHSEAPQAPVGGQDSPEAPPEAPKAAQSDSVKLLEGALKKAVSRPAQSAAFREWRGMGQTPEDLVAGTQLYSIYKR